MTKNEYPWTLETMEIINRLTPQVVGKASDPDWFLLRQRFEQMEAGIPPEPRPNCRYTGLPALNPTAVCYCEECQAFAKSLSAGKRR